MDKRQIAVLLLENEIRSLGRPRAWSETLNWTTKHQPVDAVEQVCRRLAAEVSHQ